MSERTLRPLQRVTTCVKSGYHLLASATTLPRDVQALLIETASDLLMSLRRRSQQTPRTLSEFLRNSEVYTHEAHQNFDSVLTNSSDAELRDQLEARIADLDAALAQPSLPDTVSTEFGSIRLVNYLGVTNQILVTLAYLNDLQPDHAAQTEACRAILHVLKERYPGRYLEVRIPLHAAEQIGFPDAVTVHTRGTPPNVIETDARTLILAAMGALDWADATASGIVHASGSHVGDMEHMLPIFRLRMSGS